MYGAGNGWAPEWYPLTIRPLTTTATSKRFVAAAIPTGRGR